MARKLRDSHWQRHEHPFKCEHRGCEELTDQPPFPRLNRRPIDKVPDDAIEKEDLIAVRTLAMELLDLYDAPTGFLVLSLKAQKRDRAKILTEILGETKEMNYKILVETQLYTY